MSSRIIDVYLPGEFTIQKDRCVKIHGLPRYTIRFWVGTDTIRPIISINNKFDGVKAIW